MSVRKSLGVMTLVQIVAFPLNFASVIILSRLLTPTEIGIYSVSVSFLGLAHMFREFGVGQYIIQAKDFDRDKLRAAFSVAIATSWFVAAILFLSRIPLANFYDHPGVAEILGLLAINFIIMPFGTPLLALMRRELQFNKIAFIEIACVVTQVLVTIGAALLGESYLSMAWGAIAQHVVRVSILNLMRPGEVFILPGLTGVKDVLKFGTLASMNSLVATIGDAAPSLIFGRTLGFSSVAFFSRAEGLRRMSVDNLTRIVRSVYFPSFAEKVRQGGPAAELYCQSTNYYFSVVAPILALMSILSEPLIMLLFGDQWVESVPLARLLSIYAITYAPYALWSSTAIATGNIKVAFRIQVIIQAIRISIFASSIWLDLEQVVQLFSLSFLANMFIFQWALRETISLSFSQLFTALKKSILLVLLTSFAPAIMLFAQDTLRADQYSYLRIVLAGGSLGLASWLAGVFVLKHDMRHEVLLLINKAKERLRRAD